MLGREWGGAKIYRMPDEIPRNGNVSTLFYPVEEGILKESVGTCQNTMNPIVRI